MDASATETPELSPATTADMEESTLEFNKDNDSTHRSSPPRNTVKLEDLLSAQFGSSETRGEAEVRSFWQRWRHMIANISLTIVGWAVIFGFGLAGWPGESASRHPEMCYEDPESHSECFCERLRPDAVIKQPTNTYTNLCYAAGGLIIAWCADKRAFPSYQWWESYVNLMTYEVYFSMSYSLVLTNMSYTSAFLHAGWTSWSEIVDVIGMLMIFSWIMWFSIIKLGLLITGWSVENMKRAAKFHFVLWLGGLGAMWELYQNYYAAVTFGYAMVITLFCEFFVRYYFEYCRNKERMSQTWIGIMTIVLFAIGFVCQRISNTPHHESCDSESFFQIHGLWHMMSAAAPTVLFFFFISEKNTMRKRERDVTSKTVRSNVESCAAELQQQLEDKDDSCIFQEG